VLKFPNSFELRYFSFLKRNSSTKVFKKYYENFVEAIKKAINNPEVIKVILENSLNKVLAGAGLALTAEHICYKPKVDQYMNSGKPFVFTPNRPSIVEKYTGR